MSIRERRYTIAELQAVSLEQRTRLEDQCRRLEARIETLEAALADQGGQSGSAGVAPGGHNGDHGKAIMSRAGLLKVATAAAVGLAGIAVADSMAAKPAQAAQGDPMLVGEDNTGALRRTAVFTGSQNEYAILADPGIKVPGSLGSVGVTGSGENAGIYGLSGVASGGNGVVGSLTGQSATVSSGVYGDGRGDGAGTSGVYGLSDSATGVTGVSDTGDGIVGESVAGRGAYFKGKLAPISLAPASTAGKPTSGAHVKGDVYVDKNAVLYICTKSGTPGKWSRLTASPV